MRAKTVDVLFRSTRLFDRLAFWTMSGQIADATIVAAPKQRNTIEEKKALKEGCVPEDWKPKPAKLRQKDRDARWTVRYTKANI